jgi:hypothetical protein
VKRLPADEDRFAEQSVLRLELERRRHIRSPARPEHVEVICGEKVRGLERLRDSGRVPKAGERWTFGEWLEEGGWVFAGGRA